MPFAIEGNNDTEHFWRVAVHLSAKHVQRGLWPGRPIDLLPDCSIIRYRRLADVVSFPIVRFARQKRSLDFGTALLFHVASS
jgi:hypothetical protein